MLLIMFSGCKEEEITPYSGTAEIDSRLYFNAETQNYYSYGFCFSTGKRVKYERFVSEEGVDLILQAIPGATGPAGAYLQSPGNDEAFNLEESFQQSSDAQSYFNNLLLVTSQTFTHWANPLEPNQIWVIRTLNGHFAKVWIQSVDILSTYVSIRFAWVYQPDGTPTFPE